MKRNVIKKTICSVLGLFVVLSGVLVYHIYSVTRTRNDLRTSRQLGRIDFTHPMDSAQATAIRYHVAGLAGIESTHFNYASNILVYSYYPDKQSSDSILASVKKQGNYGAKKYEVSAGDIAKGCPVADKNSFTYRASAFASNLLK